MIDWRTRCVCTHSSLVFSSTGNNGASPHCCPRCMTPRFSGDLGSGRRSDGAEGEVVGSQANSIESRDTMVNGANYCLLKPRHKRAHRRLLFGITQKIILLTCCCCCCRITTLVPFSSAAQSCGSNCLHETGRSIPCKQHQEGIISGVKDPTQPLPTHSSQDKVVIIECRTFFFVGSGKKQVGYRGGGLVLLPPKKERHDRSRGF